MGRKISVEKAKDRFEKRNLILLGEYKNSMTKVTFKDFDGYKYFLEPNKVFGNYNFSPFHNGNVYTIENIENWIKLNDLNFILISKKYINNKKNLIFHCLKCNEDFEKSWNCILKRPYCSQCNGFKITEKNNLLYIFPDICQEFDIEKNIGFKPSNIYPKSKKYFWWKCKVCNHSWKTSVINRTDKRSGCPACAGIVLTDKNNMLARYPEISKEWHPIKNGILKPSDVFPGRNKNVWWICGICGHEWMASPNKRTYKSHGCPICKRSKGELKISEYLDNNGINYKTQHSFSDLLGDGGISLKFDFAIFEKMNLIKLIEFDGIFHYKKLYKNDKYELCQKYDAKKNLYCMKNNISLLRIPYWKFDDIEEILEDALNLQRKEV